jgi:hypothetical protein
MRPPQQVGMEFYTSLLAEDELGVVVRAHIHVEASIVEFLELSVPHPQQIPRLNYEARLRLACALGLDQDHFHALKLLGDIRNLFSHNLSASLTDAKVNELFSKLPEFAQSNALTSYDMTRSDHPNAPDFRALSAKDRFVFIAVGLKMFVFNAVNLVYLQRHDT